MGLFATFKKPAFFTGKAASVPASLTKTDKREASFTNGPSEVLGIEQHLLFVGMAAAWFQSIERDLRLLQPRWTGLWVEDGAQAMAALRRGNPFAVVLNVSAAGDASLLAAIEKQNHATVRVVICASDDRAELVRLSATGAKPLPQSTDGAGIAATISRLARVQEWMADASMKKLLAQCHKLPALPKLYSQVTAELSSPNGSIDVVAHCIAQDPVMAAKLLQVVNSAFFALGHEVAEPTEAVLYMGAERTRSLILLAGVFTQYENSKCPGFSPDKVWNHSLQVGTLARTIALAETRNAKLAEAAFTAGLLHDMGKLILAANVPLMCAAIEQLHAGKKLTQREAELQVLGTTHAELAACLLGTWGLPLPVLEAVAWHHAPGRSEDTGFSLLTAVHAANVFADDNCAEGDSSPLPRKLDHDYLHRIGMEDRRNDWRKACNLPSKREEDMDYARFRARRAAKMN